MQQITIIFLCKDFFYNNYSFILIFPPVTCLVSFQSHKYNCIKFLLYHLYYLCHNLDYRGEKSQLKNLIQCILRHRCVQLILAYIWARPAILVAGKGKGGMFIFLLFLHFHSCSSFFPVPLFHLLYSLFSHSLGDDTK